MVAQLNACGLVETIKLAARGHPHKVPYAALLQRYFRIPKQELEALIPDQLLQLARQKLSAAFPEVEVAQQVCFGLTKAFFKDKQFFSLEQARIGFESRAVVLIQACARAHLLRRKYLATKA